MSETFEYVVEKGICQFTYKRYLCCTVLQLSKKRLCTVGFDIRTVNEGIHAE